MEKVNVTKVQTINIMGRNTILQHPRKIGPILFSALIGIE
jgi:hypothetical protein